MDVAQDIVEPTPALSYDDTIPYEEQIPTEPMTDTMEGATPSLAGRISSAKLYLMSESSVAKAAKRKHDDEEEMAEDKPEEADVTDEFDPSRRANAILFSGPPISHLPTARLFAYAKHFDVEPMGLEWINDNTCVFVFPSKSSARKAYSLLQKSAAEAPDADSLVTAKSIPVEMWPAEDRINTSLGKGQGLKGTIRMRWALLDDVKKKRAGQDSEFYKKHGRMAGKEMYGGEGVPPAKRRRPDPHSGEVLDEAAQKALLDAELDQFLAEEDDEAEGGSKTPGSPPSRMRSDFIGNDGRTVLDGAAEKVDLASRLAAPVPRRGGGGRRSRERDLAARISSPGDRPGSRRGGRRGDRRPGRHEPKKVTQEDLDAELDAFLSERK